MKKIFFIYSLITLLTIAGCAHKKCGKIKYNSCSRSYSLIEKEVDFNYQGNVTIFVHGTLPPVIAPLIRILDTPFGFFPATCLSDRFILSRIPYILERADSEEFPLETHYLFGWCGDLTFKAREEAAEELYYYLKKFKGKITVIGHSHGGNVALELAHAALKHGDTDFVIDRLILLACPIQKMTSGYASSPVFKKVFNIYSRTDSTQILDPQGAYRASKELKNNGIEVPFFSERELPDSPNITQARILMKGSNLAHMDFIRPGFLKRLPEIIRMLDRLPGGCSRHTINTVRWCSGSPYLAKLCVNRFGRKHYVRIEQGEMVE